MENISLNLDNMMEDNNGINDIRLQLAKATGGIAGQLHQQASTQAEQKKMITELQNTQDSILKNQENITNIQSQIATDQKKLTKAQLDAQKNLGDISKATSSGKSDIQSITEKSLELLNSSKKRGNSPNNNTNTNNSTSSEFESIQENRTKPSKPIQQKPDTRKGMSGMYDPLKTLIRNSRSTSKVTNNDYLGILNSARSIVNDNKKPKSFISRMSDRIIDKGSNRDSSLITKLIGSGVSGGRGIIGALRSVKNLGATRRESRIKRGVGGLQQSQELLSAKQARLESINQALINNPTDKKLLKERDKIQSGKSGISNLRDNIIDTSKSLSGDVTKQYRHYQKQIDPKAMKGISREDRSYLDAHLMDNIHKSFTSGLDRIVNANTDPNSNHRTYINSGLGGVESELRASSAESNVNKTTRREGSLRQNKRGLDSTNASLVRGVKGKESSIFSTKLNTVSTPSTAGEYISGTYNQLSKLNLGMASLLASDFGKRSSGGGGGLFSLLSGLFTSFLGGLAGLIPTLLAGVASGVAGLAGLALGGGKMALRGLAGVGKFVTGRGQFWRRVQKHGGVGKAMQATVRNGKRQIGTAGGKVGGVVSGLLRKKATGAVGESVAKNAGKSITKTAGKSIATTGIAKLAGKQGSKLGLKSIVKKIPVVGALAGIGFGLARLVNGDPVGAALEVGSGISGSLGGVGTVASLGMDAMLLKRDLGRQQQQAGGNNQPTVDVGLTKSNIDSDDKIDMMRIQAKLIAYEMFKMEDSAEYRDSQKPIIDSYSKGVYTALK